MKFEKTLSVLFDRTKIRLGRARFFTAAQEPPKGSQRLLAAQRTCSVCAYPVSAQANYL